MKRLFKKTFLFALILSAFICGFRVFATDYFSLSKGFTYSKIPVLIQHIMQGKSYKENEYIKFDDLRLCKVKHIGFDGKTHTGQLIVARTAVLENGERIDFAKEDLEIFKELYDAKYPISQIRLIDNYGADDEKSMLANNSSAFNFRYIGDTEKISWHSYGLAIDINPLFNPCYNPKSQFIEPAGSEGFLDRTPRENQPDGIIREGDDCYNAFVKRGWQWGGSWSSPIDYMHFQKIKHTAPRPPAKYVIKN